MTPSQARFLQERRERLARMAAPLPQAQSPKGEVVPFAHPKLVDFKLEQRIRQAEQIAAGMAVKWRARRPPLMLKHVSAMTAQFYGITPEDLASASRKPEIVWPRQVAMYLCLRLSERSQCEIARHFGGRDHTCVSHGAKRVAQYCARHEIFRDDLQVLTMRILERFDAMPFKLSVAFQPQFFYRPRKRGGGPKSPWTPSLERALAMMWERGDSIPDIEAALSVSRGAVCSKARRMNLTRRRVGGREQ